MKARLTLIFAALVVLLGAMVWVVEDRATVATSSAARAMTPVPLRDSAPDAALLPSTTSRTGPAARPTPARVQADPTAAVPLGAPAQTRPAGPPPGLGASAPTVRVETSGDVTYVARAGDTVTELAIALLGSDSRERRDAVIDANPSLQADPDLVLAGETYSIDPSPARAADPAGGDARPRVAASAQSASPRENAPGVTPAESGVTAAEATPRKMTYMAQIGDTVRVLAAHLLGGDTKANRAAIVAANASLRRDPDHLVAGENYTIVAPDGLTADPDAPKQQASTTEPEADEVLRLGIGRLLRYTARPGDTVSKLAASLLGGDTRANRDSIINDNPSLKDDPDHLVAGQTYWITAPMAE